MKITHAFVATGPHDESYLGSRAPSKSASRATAPCYAAVVRDGLRIYPFSGAAHLALSAEGTLVWTAGEDANLSRFVWVGRDGRGRDTLPIPPSRINSFALSRDGHRLAYSVTLPGTRSVVRVVDLARKVVVESQLPAEVQVGTWVAGDTAFSVVFDETRLALAGGPATRGARNHARHVPRGVYRFVGRWPDALRGGACGQLPHPATRSGSKTP